MGNDDSLKIRDTRHTLFSCGGEEHTLVYRYGKPSPSGEEEARAGGCVSLGVSRKSWTEGFFSESGGTMQTNRRTGADRRRRKIPVIEERRRAIERRELMKDPDQTAGRLRIIPLFEGLSTGQLQKLLNICLKRVYTRGEIIYAAGEEPEKMFVLVQGKLRVEFPDGMVLDNLGLSGVFGERGLITGERRTVTVGAAMECIVLLFGKEELFRVFSEDADIRNRVMTNIIRDMAMKLRNEGEMLDSLRKMRAVDLL